MVRQQPREFDVSDDPRFLEQVLRSVPSVVYVRDAQTHEHLFTNRDAGQMLGYSAAEIAAHGFVNLIHPDDLGIYHRYLQHTHSIVPEETSEVEYRVRHKDGSWRWLRLRENVLNRNADGAVTQIVGGVEDVTDHKLSEQELVESKRFVESILSTTPNYIIVYGTDGITDLFANRQDPNLMGHSLAELRDMGSEFLARLVHPDDLPSMGQHIEWLQTSREDQAHEIEFRFLHKDGTWRWMLARDTVLSRGDDGEVRQLLGVGTDVTDRKRAEEALKTAHTDLERKVAERTEEVEREKAFFEDAIESMPGVFYVLDTQGCFVRWNANMATIVGRGEQGLAGVSALDLFVDEDKPVVAERIGRVFTEGEATTEGRLQSPTGPVPHFFTGKLATLDGQPCLVGLGVDITDRRAAEIERERLNAQLASKNAELEQIVYVTSHDLRSPLVNVQGFSKELARSVDDILETLDDDAIPAAIQAKVREIAEEDVAEAVGFILNSVRKMDGLLAGLLRLSRIGRSPVRPERVDMSELMQRVLEDVGFRVKEADVELRCEALDDCFGDRVSLEQLFSNLVDNALKYLDRGRAGTIRVSSETYSEHVVYCVQDNGRGIARDYQEKIFEIFHRLEPDEGSGEGLGLTIVRRIVDKHDGRIWIESSPGEGARFFVALPRVRPDGPSAELPSVEATQ